MTIFLCIVLAFVALLLIGIVLIQDSSAGGLTGAFGGGGGGGELLGAKGQKELAKFTTILAVGFVSLCIIVGVMQAANEQSSLAPDDEGPATSSVGAVDPGATSTGDSGTPVTPGITVTPGETVTPPANTTTPPTENNTPPPANTPPTTQPAVTPGTPPPAEGNQGGQ